MPRQTDPLATPAIENPLVVQMRKDVADGIHNSRPGAFANIDVLAEGIVDVIYNETVQGATFLEVHIADPGWQMLQPRKALSGQSFIDVDDDGWLQPVWFEFPKGFRKTWTMVAANPTSDTTGANIILTFEDATSSYLRQKNKDEVGGPGVSHPNETRFEFIARILKAVDVHPTFEFSQATKTFETEPPQQTPASIVAWDKWWTHTQADRQKMALAVRTVVSDVTGGIDNIIQSLPVFVPPVPAPNNVNWWNEFGPNDGRNLTNQVYIPPVWNITASNPYGIPPAGFVGHAGA